MYLDSTEIIKILFYGIIEENNKMKGAKIWPIFYLF
jgi:hypothetical protein